MTHYTEIKPSTVTFTDASYRRIWDEVRLRELQAKVREAEAAQKELEKAEAPVVEEKKHWWNR